jgi:hypothetical protein
MKRMLLNPAYSTRNVSLLFLGACGALALWLFAPWAGGSFGSSGGDAALPPKLQLAGEVQVTAHNDIVTRLVVPVTAAGDEGVVLPENGYVRAETALSETSAAAVPAIYSISWLDGNGDGVLDPGEHALLTVDLPDVSSVHPGNPLRLVIRPTDSVSIAVDGVLP